MGVKEWISKKDTEISSFGSFKMKVGILPEQVLVGKFGGSQWSLVMVYNTPKYLPLSPGMLQNSHWIAHQGKLVIFYIKCFP